MLSTIGCWVSSLGGSLPAAPGAPRGPAPAPRALAPLQSHSCAKRNWQRTRDQLETASIGGRSGERGINAPCQPCSSPVNAAGGSGGAKNPTPALIATGPPQGHLNPLRVQQLPALSHGADAEPSPGDGASPWAAPRAGNETSWNGEVLPVSAGLGPKKMRGGAGDGNGRPSWRVPKQRLRASAGLQAPHPPALGEGQHKQQPPKKTFRVPLSPEPSATTPAAAEPWAEVKNENGGELQRVTQTRASIPGGLGAKRGAGGTPRNRNPRRRGGCSLQGQHCRVPEALG